MNLRLIHGFFYLPGLIVCSIFLISVAYSWLLLRKDRNKTLYVNEVT